MDFVRLVFGAPPRHARVLARGGKLIRKPPPNAAWRNVRPREHTRPVRAWIADGDQRVRAASGKLQAKAGQDVIVEHGDHEHSVVRLDIFERTYEPLGGGLYRKRDDVTLRYFTLDRPAIVETLEGPQEARPGDWIMQGVSGELWPVPADQALEKYQPV